MPGRHITDHQMELYMTHRKKDCPALAGARAGFSTATAYRIEADAGRPSEKRKGRGRRPPDPLAGIFEEEIVPLLEASPGLRAVALYEEMMRRHPELHPGVRRTVQRRVRAWKAKARAGAGDHLPAEARAGAPGPVGLDRRRGAGGEHRRGAAGAQAVPLPAGVLGVLPCGGGACWAGRAYVALAGGLQDALWALGGVPKEHRTDSLSAAFRNL